MAVRGCGHVIRWLDNMKFIVVNDATADMIEHEAARQGLTKAELVDKMMGIYWLEKSQYITVAE